LLIEIDTTKGQIEQFGLESGELLKEQITMKTVDIIVEKSTQIKSQVDELTNRFQ
jgi:hypothetical protein